MRRFSIGLLFIVALGVLFLAASAQDLYGANSSQAVAQTSQEPSMEMSLLSSDPGNEITYTQAITSTPGTIYQTFSGMHFRPYNSSQQFAYNIALGDVYVIGTASSLTLPIILPDKAQVTELTYSFTDASPDFDMILGLCRIPIGAPPTACVKWWVNSTGVNAPGVTTRTLRGSPILVIDNANNAYSFVAFIATPNQDFGVVNARIGYRLGSYIPAITK